jgi:predicted site-specific integrase-resolvase
VGWKDYRAGVGGYRIAELAERSGFTATTLRYYEQVGVLDPPVRTPAGYRLYDDAALDRLAFVDRAKRMGLAARRRRLPSGAASDAGAAR